MASKKPVISKYDPAMCERIVELGRLGFTQKAMWSDIGISKSTADKWRKDNPDFAEAVSRATTESQAWWEREGMANLSNRTYNTGLYEVMTKSMFPEDYREVKDNKVELKAEIKVDFNKEINDLITALKEQK